MYKFLQVF